MPPPSSELRHPIKVVCRRTGLSAHVIRVWGKRYGLDCCQRTESNRRLYSDAMIERLRLLKELTDCGHRISRIAYLCLEELRHLHQCELTAQPAPRASSPVEECLQACLEAVRKFDAPALTQLLEEARLRHGQCATLLRVVIPLVQQVGDAWCKGELRMAHERLVTSAVRDFIALGARHSPQRDGAPEIVVATPPGQAQEVGALLVAAAARGLGWKATFLGAAIPAAEIAACAQARKARAVALSLVHPSGDPGVTEHLASLRKLLPEHTAILIGGHAAPDYHKAIQDKADVLLVGGLADLESILEGLH
jgi:DNA-binding transcriptional MerR regulator/methylmalonyl-CoA mutase cobalamin-binding subunit